MTKRLASEASESFEYLDLERILTKDDFILTNKIKSPFVGFFDDMDMNELDSKYDLFDLIELCKKNHGTDIIVHLTEYKYLFKYKYAICELFYVLLINCDEEYNCISYIFNNIDISEYDISTIFEYIILMINLLLFHKILI
jgi:hypothetical protein